MHVGVEQVVHVRYENLNIIKKETHPSCGNFTTNLRGTNGKKSHAHDSTTTGGGGENGKNPFLNGCH